MATPDQINLLQPNDKVSYQFILESSGPAAADAFLEQKLQLYQTQQQAIQLEEQKRLQKEERDQASKQIAPYDNPPTRFALTPEQQEAARQSIQNYLQQRGLQGEAKREIVGITPDPLSGEVRVGPPMEQQVIMRRETIPSQADIQGQAEQTYESIRQQAANEGRPSRKAVEDALYMQAVANYEMANGPISNLGVMEQTAVENDLRQQAYMQSLTVSTAEDIADAKIEGRFGVGRPRQAGSAYSDPPTPIIFNQRQPGERYSAGGVLLSDPERAKEMSVFDTFVEAIKPQTIRTAEEIRRENLEQNMAYGDYIMEVRRRLVEMNGDNYKEAPKNIRRQLEDQVVIGDFDDFYQRVYDEAMQQMKINAARNGVTYEQSMYDQAAKRIATQKTAQEVENFFPPDRFSAAAVELKDKYSKSKQFTDYMADLDIIGMKDIAGQVGGQLLEDATTEPLPFTGEITESIGMTVLRDLNLPFRMVLNPLEEVYENTLGGGTAGQKVGYIDPVSGELKRSFYDVPTYDFTEEVSGFGPTMDAYLKEVAVETATAYGTGNALANYTYVPESADAAMALGTVGEIFMPWATIAKGTQKAATGFGTLGRAARAMDIAADGNAMVAAARANGLNTMADVAQANKVKAPVIGRTYNTANKVAYEAADNVTAVDYARQYTYYVSKGDINSAQGILRAADDSLGPNAKAIFKAGIADIEDIDDIAMAGKAGKRFQELDKTIDDLAKQDTIYGDVASEIRKEGRARAYDPASARDYTEYGTGRVIKGMPEEVSPKQIDGYAGELGPARQSYSVEKGGARARGGASSDQLVGVAGTRLARYGIDDYVALTDRVGIQSEVFEQIFPELSDDMRIFNNQMNLTNRATPDELKGIFKERDLSDPDVIEAIEDFDSYHYEFSPYEFLTHRFGKTKRRDPELDRILKKLSGEDGISLDRSGFDILTPAESTYLQQRYLEHRARALVAGTDTSPLKQRAAVIDRTPQTERAFRPEELRPERGARPLGIKAVERATRTTGLAEQSLQASSAATRYVTSLIKPSMVEKTALETGRRLAGRAPKGVAVEGRQAAAALDAAQQSVARLDRAFPEAIRFFGRNSANPADAAYSVYASTLNNIVDDVPTGLQDATRVLTMNEADAVQLVRDGARTSISGDEIVDIMRFVFPDLQPEDIARLRGAQVRSATELEALAIEQINIGGDRLKKGMLAVDGNPDTTKALLALAGNNSAKHRVSEAAQQYLSPIALPVEATGPQLRKFYFNEATQLLEGGQLSDDVLLEARYRAAFSSDRFDNKIQAAYGIEMESTLGNVKNDIFEVAQQMRMRGLQLDMTPASMREQVLRNVQDTIIDSENVGALVSADARADIASLNALYSDPAKLGLLRTNIDELYKQNPSLANWALKVMGGSFSDMRRSFVSGQLGGKYVPNIRYQAENIATAPLISSVTAPGANRVLLKPFVNSVKGASFEGAGGVRAKAMDPAVANKQVPGSMYTYRQTADAMNRYNLGASQTSINFGDVVLEDLRQELLRSSKALGKNNIILEQIDYNIRNMGAKASYSSPGMRFAMDTDYAFRENLFIGAVQDGKTFEEAAQLAKTAYLDYGDLPSWAKKAGARGLLYFSFTYRTGVETAKALANPKSAAQLARLARAHVVMAKSTGTYYYTGDQALQSVWISANDGDGDYDSANLYYRDPWMGQLMMGAEGLTYITQAMRGDPEVTPTRTMQGILDYIYVPHFDILMDLDPDYKKGVPPKTMYRILMAQQYAGNIPNVFPSDSIAGTVTSNIPGGAEYYVDRYDLEIRPIGKNVPGSPTYNNYQYRFGSKEGYNRFYLDSLALTIMGAKRLADDATTMMILSGIIPEGSEFGYLENGSPVLYLPFRETPMPVPKDWEMMDRRLRSQQYRLKELQRTFGETSDTKAGDQKK